MKSRAKDSEWNLRTQPAVGRRREREQHDRRHRPIRRGQDDPRHTVHPPRLAGRPGRNLRLARREQGTDYPRGGRDGMVRYPRLSRQRAPRLHRCVRPRVFELHPERIARVRRGLERQQRSDRRRSADAGPLVHERPVRATGPDRLHVQTDPESRNSPLYARGTWPGRSRGSGDRDPDVPGGLRRPLEVQQRPREPVAAPEHRQMQKQPPQSVGARLPDCPRPRDCDRGGRRPKGGLGEGSVPASSAPAHALDAEERAGRTREIPRRAHGRGLPQPEAGASPRADHPGVPGGVSLFPGGLIASADVSMCAAPASAGRAGVLASVFAVPAISLQEIASRVGLTRQSVSKVASELAEFGLARLVDDGRFRRVYSTDLLSRKREANRGRTRAFEEAVLRRLMEEGLAPELVRREETRLLVRFGTGATRVLLEIPVDPYATAWKTTA